jgi:hypothetical protein
MMTRLHKSAKSPPARTRSELEKTGPDWDGVARSAKGFFAMSDLLRKNREGYRSPEKYISSAAALPKAAGEKDHAAASAPFTGLSKSCASCHFYNVRGE